VPARPPAWGLLVCYPILSGREDGRKYTKLLQSLYVRCGLAIASGKLCIGAVIAVRPRRAYNNAAIEVVKPRHCMTVYVKGYKLTNSDRMYGDSTHAWPRLGSRTLIVEWKGKA
jgi:hypothetical protein